MPTEDDDVKRMFVKKSRAQIFKESTIGRIVDFGRRKDIRFEFGLNPPSSKVKTVSLLTSTIRNVENRLTKIGVDCLCSSRGKCTKAQKPRNSTKKSLQRIIIVTYTRVFCILENI